MSFVYNSTGYEMYNTKITNSKGCYIFDNSGNKYLDLESGVWCLPLGHQHPKIMEAMQEQMSRLCHVGYKYNDEIVEKAAEKLIGISGILSAKCVFLSSGSEAVEYGIQMAKVLNPDKKCVCLQNQYLSAYGHGANLLNPEWIRIPWNDQEEKSVEKWTYELISTINFNSVGAFVFEAGNSSGLVKLPPFNLVTALNKIMKAIGAFIVVDEITCGIGRTGKWFGYMHYDIEPDIVAVGKGLGNGYPVSAVVIKHDLAVRLDQVNFHYAQSHQNDPLGCRIAFEVLETIEEENLLENTKFLGKYFRDEYRRLQQTYSVISEVRGIGFLNSIQFSDEILEHQLVKLDKILFSRGFIVGMKPKEKVLRTYNPLMLDKTMVDSYIENLDNCLRELL